MVAQVIPLLILLVSFDGRVLQHAGSIFDTHKRRLLQPLVYVRAASLAVETGFLGAGLIPVFVSPAMQPYSESLSLRSRILTSLPVVYVQSMRQLL